MTSSPTAVFKLGDRQGAGKCRAQGPAPQCLAQYLGSGLGINILNKSPANSHGGNSTSNPTPKTLWEAGLLGGKHVAVPKQGWVQSETTAHDLLAVTARETGHDRHLWSLWFAELVNE